MAKIIRTFLLSAIITVQLCTGAKAQTHEAAVNLFPMMFGNYSGNYFYNVDELNSYGVVAGGYPKLNFLKKDLTVYGVYAAAEYRHYPKPVSENDGYFVGASLKFRMLGSDADPADTTNSNFRLTGVGPGITTGYHFVTDVGITIGVSAGVSYLILSEVTYANNYKPTIEDEAFYNWLRLDFRLGVNVGYRFGL